MDDRASVKIKVLFFGQARELAGTGGQEIELQSPATVADSIVELKRRFPKLSGIEASLLFAINENYASRESLLSDGDSLAVMPPVSGGEQAADHFEITRDAIDLPALRRRLLGGESGAIVIFDGVARNNTRGRPTLYLEYEGYESMALRMMGQIGREVHDRWPVNAVGIVHRLGRVEVSESSVVIVVTSAHRKAAFEACQYAIDRLKKIVPIWKKEYFEDGEVWVEGERGPGL